MNKVHISFEMILFIHELQNAIYFSLLTSFLPDRLLHNTQEMNSDVVLRFMCELPVLNNKMHYVIILRNTPILTHDIILFAHGYSIQAIHLW